PEFAGSGVTDVLLHTEAGAAAAVDRAAGVNGGDVIVIDGDVVHRGEHGVVVGQLHVVAALRRVHRGTGGIEAGAGGVGKPAGGAGGDAAGIADAVDQSHLAGEGS